MNILEQIQFLTHSLEVFAACEELLYDLEDQRGRQIKELRSRRENKPWTTFEDQLEGEV